MVKKRNGIVYLQKSLDAFNTVIVNRYIIIACLPFLLKYPVDQGGYIGLFSWIGVLSTVFLTLTLLYHKRFDPYECRKQIENKNEIELKSNSSNSKSLAVIRHLDGSNTRSEYVLIKAVIDIVLTYATLQQLGMMLEPLLFANTSFGTLGVIISFCTPLLYIYTACAFIYYANKLDTEDTNAYHNLSKRLKELIRFKEPRQEQKKIKHQWYNTLPYKLFSFTALIMAITQQHYIEMFIATTYIEALISIGLCLLLIQVLHTTISYAKDKIPELISAGQAMISVIAAANAMNLLSRQHWLSMLKPLASKIGLMDFSNTLVYSLSNIFYTQIIWTYGIASYRINRNNKHIRHIAKQATVLPKETERTPVSHNDKDEPQTINSLIFD